jgi:hypothetical protein
VERIHGDRHRHAGGAAPVVTPAVELIGARARLEHRLGIVEPPRRHPEALEDLWFLDQAAHRLECLARFLPVTPGEPLVGAGQQGAGLFGVHPPKHPSTPWLRQDRASMVRSDQPPWRKMVRPDDAAAQVPS